MGTYKKGILGAFSGKVGTVIGSSWNGIDYMRSLPRPSTKAPTDLQMIQRVKLTLVAGFLQPISRLVSLGYKGLAHGKSGYNVATAQILADAVTGVYPDFEIDYTKVLFSKGNLTGAWNPQSTSVTPAELTVNWTDNSGSGTAEGTDKVIILAYNPLKSQFVFNIETGAMRSEGTDTMIVPDNFSGDTIEVWIAFLTADKKAISTSIHAGQVLIS